MEAGLPVARHLACRAGRWLIFRVPLRLRQSLAGNHLAGPVIIKPGLSWLEAGCNRMPCGMKMLRCVLAGRTVATADMPAFSTTPQMQPPSARGEALDAALAARRQIGIDTLTLGFHGRLLTAVAIFCQLRPLQ
jgi:hypothetical protein